MKELTEAGLGLVGAAEHVCAARRLNDDERIEKAVKRLTNVEGARAAERAFYHAKVWKGLPGAGVVPRCVSLSELVCPSRVSVPPPGNALDEEVGPPLSFEACERERVALQLIMFLTVFFIYRMLAQSAKMWKLQSKLRARSRRAACSCIFQCFLDQCLLTGS